MSTLALAAPAQAAVDVPYLDADGVIRIAPTAIDLDGTETFLGGGDGEWYLCSGILSFADTVVVGGTVHLILGDGCRMDVAALGATPGIDVRGAEALTIYAQSTGAAMGRLSAAGGTGGAGIGSDTASGAGTITIIGGDVDASGGVGGAGIGGGSGRPGGTVVIRGGDVLALGYGGAGIGGGAAAAGGSVTIAGGRVLAESFGGPGGAGIGGGVGGAGGRVTVTGTAIVEARGADGAGVLGGGAGIGSGGTDQPAAAAPGTILFGFTTGMVTTSGGSAGAPAGAGASYGYGGSASGDGPEPPFFTVDASAGAGGSITPSGTLTAMQLTDITFTITPDPGYVVAAVTENGADLGAVTSHTIPGLTGNTVMTAAFALAPSPSPTPPPDPAPTPTSTDAAALPDPPATVPDPTASPLPATRLAASGPYLSAPVVASVAAVMLGAGITLRVVGRRRAPQHPKGLDR